MKFWDPMPFGVVGSYLDAPINFGRMNFSIDLDFYRLKLSEDWDKVDYRSSGIILESGGNKKLLTFN